jgi:hypothetical protein
MLSTVFVIASLHLPSLAVAAVTNDHFVSATVLSVQSGSASGNNTGATIELNEPQYVIENGSEKSVWWRWTAPNSGRATFDTIGSEGDTILAIYAGSSLEDLTELGANDDFGATSESRVTFDAEAGNDYFIVVDSFSGTGSGPITLNWMLRPPAILDAPTMVYSYREVNTFQGTFMSDDSYYPRSTSVYTGFIVRGRKTDAFEQERTEFGPTALIRLYSIREGTTLKKYYSLAKGIPPVAAETPGHFESQLVRVSSRSTGVFESAGYLVSYDDGGYYPSVRLIGKATLSKITPTQTTSTWFAKKLSGATEAYSPDESSDTEFAQGEPSPGYYDKTSTTLTFNSAETRAVEGLDFDDALAVVLSRLQTRGYEPAE